jgi:hypothetical protein
MAEGYSAYTSVDFAHSPFNQSFNSILLRGEALDKESSKKDQAIGIFFSCSD